MSRINVPPAHKCFEKIPPRTTFQFNNDEIMGLTEDEDASEECKQLSEYQRRTRGAINKAQMFINEHSAAADVGCVNTTERVSIVSNVGNLLKRIVNTIHR